MMKDMQTMLSACGLCHQTSTRTPKPTFKLKMMSDKITVNNLPKAFTKKHITIPNPLQTSVNITVKNLTRGPQTMPKTTLKLPRRLENTMVKNWPDINPSPSQKFASSTVKVFTRDPKSTPKIPQTSEYIMTTDGPNICSPGQNNCKTSRKPPKPTPKPHKTLANITVKDWSKMCLLGQKICKTFIKGPKKTIKILAKSAKIMLKDRRKICSPGQNSCHSHAKCVPEKRSGLHHCKVGRI